MTLNCAGERGELLDKVVMPAEVCRISARLSVGVGKPDRLHCSGDVRLVLSEQGALAALFSAGGGGARRDGVLGTVLMGLVDVEDGP